MPSNKQQLPVGMMCSDVRKVWNEHRTESTSGRPGPGRNVAWDYVLENMNLLNSKQYLNGHITEERLRDFGAS